MDGGDVDGETAAKVVRLPVRGRRVRWTLTLESIFLDHLAATGDITAAARAINLHPSQAYYRLRTHPAFVEGWEAAIEAGYMSVEISMIGQLLSSDPDVGLDQSTNGKPFDWDKALRLMAQRAARTAGKSGRGGPKRTVKTREESDAIILERLAKVAARTKRLGESA